MEEFSPKHSIKLPKPEIFQTPSERDHIGGEMIFGQGLYHRQIIDTLKQIISSKKRFFNVVLVEKRPFPLDQWANVHPDDEAPEGYAYIRLKNLTHDMRDRIWTELRKALKDSSEK